MLYMLYIVSCSLLLPPNNGRLAACHSGARQGHHDAVAVLLTADDILGDQRIAALQVAVDKGSSALGGRSQCE